MRFGTNTRSSVVKHSISAKFKRGGGGALVSRYHHHYRHHHLHKPRGLLKDLLGGCLLLVAQAGYNNDGGREQIHRNFGRWRGNIDAVSWD